MIFDQWLETTRRKSSGAPEKVHSSPKNLNPLFANNENIQPPPPAERGGGELGGHCASIGWSLIEGYTIIAFF